MPTHFFTLYAGYSSIFAPFQFSYCYWKNFKHKYFHFLLITSQNRHVSQVYKQIFNHMQQSSYTQLKKGRFNSKSILPIMYMFHFTLHWAVWQQFVQSCLFHLFSLSLLVSKLRQTKNGFFSFPNSCNESALRFIWVLRFFIKITKSDSSIKINLQGCLYNILPIIFANKDDTHKI